LSRNFEVLMAPSKKLYITMEVDNKKNVPIENDTSCLELKKSPIVTKSFLNRQKKLYITMAEVSKKSKQ